MKVTVYVPGFGWTTYEADSIESELATLRKKYPEVAAEIVVREPVPPRQYSDTELRAMNEPDSE